jgi:hypothetical protein
MKKERLTIMGSILALALSAVCVAQVNKEVSPFERYRQSTVNELEFRKIKFDVASIRLSLQPTPLPNGLGAPFVEGEAANGKLIVQVNVYSSDLPQTVDARKDAMWQAVNVSHAAFSYAFGTLEERKFFDKWIVVQFFDEEKLSKASKSKDTKPVDPYIGIYENGELVLR